MNVLKTKSWTYVFNLWIEPIVGVSVNFLLLSCIGTMTEDHCVYLKLSFKKFHTSIMCVDDILMDSNDKRDDRCNCGWLLSNSSTIDLDNAVYML